IRIEDVGQLQTLIAPDVRTNSGRIHDLTRPLANQRTKQGCLGRALLEALPAKQNIAVFISIGRRSTGDSGHVEVGHRRVAGPDANRLGRKVDVPVAAGAERVYASAIRT